MEQKTIIAPPKGAQDALEELVRKMYISNVFKRLRELNQPSETDKKRWVWELIQNAKDTIASDSTRQSINVWIKIDGDTVTFTHDGNPFSLNARFGLLWKYSEAKENQESTGRFGTGFLTTHCLSKVVSIESDVYEAKDSQELLGFKVTMFRDGDTEAELLEGLDKMRESEEYFKETFGHTAFKYHIKSESGREAVKLGLSSFYHNIAQTMLFCPELNSVEMDDNGSVTRIFRGKVNSLENGMNVATINFTGAIETCRTFIISGIERASEELTARYKNPRKLRLQAAVEIDSNNRIVNDDDSCGFYCVLPLVGIETQLNEPIYINCPDFEPDSERQSLLLKGQAYNGENGLVTEVGINRMIYPEILNLYRKLLSHIVNTNAMNIHLMAKGLKEIKNHEKLDREWYRDNVVRGYREALKSLKICNAVHVEYKLALADSIIIKDSDLGKEQMLLDIVSAVYPTSILANNHEWASVIWRDKDIRVWDLEEFCKHISESFRNWNEIPNLKENNLAEWYNVFLALVISQKEQLLTEYALLPDKYGNFHKKDDTIKQNINISDHALDILQKLGKDKKGELLHSAIKSIRLEREYTSTLVAADINNRVKDIVTQSDWLVKLLPLLSAIPTDESRFTNHPGFCEKRCAFLEIAKKLYGYELAGIEENTLIADSWRELDLNFVNAALCKISECGKLESMPDGVDVEWLNRALMVLKPSSEQWSNYNLLPNQYGIFKKREEVSIDNGIEDLLKSDSLKPIDIDPRDYLLDSRIGAKSLGIERVQTTAGIIAAIRNRFESMPSHNGVFTYRYEGRYYKYSQQTLLPIAKYIAGLLPRDKESEHFKMQNDFVMVVDALAGGVPYSGMIGYTNSDLWTVPNMLIAKDLFETIKSDGSIDGSSKRLDNCGTKRIVELLNNLYHCLDALRINSEGATIVPNQHGQYCILSTLYDESNEPDELLKDIAAEIPGGEDYRQVLIHPGIERRRGAFKSNEEIALFVDNRVIVLFNAPLNWQDDQFRNAVTKFIESWGQEHKAHFESLKTYRQKDAITVNVIITPEVRSKLQAIVRVGTDVSVIEKAKENAERVKALEEENARLNAQLASRAIAGSGGERNDLTTAQRQAYLDEARKLVLEDLAKDGFDISDAVYDYTRIYGVRDCEGNNRPIVFRSNLSHRSTVISPEDWIILNQPGAMFGVVSEYGKVGKYNLIDMLKEQEAMTIRFSSSNLEWPHHLSEMTKIFHYFNGIQFDFERFISPTLERWENFLAPELKTGEQASANPNIFLPD